MTVKLSDSWKSQYIIDNKTKITQVKLFTIEIKLREPLEIHFTLFKNFLNDKNSELTFTCQKKYTNYLWH